MKEIILALLKSKDILCVLAFLFALFAAFESTFIHGLDTIERMAGLGQALANTLADKGE